LDIDYFKAINDSFGHAAGDQVIRGVADHIRQVVRSADVVGRLGADGTLLWISPSIRTVFGREPTEIVGTPFRISAPQSRAHMEQLMARAIREHADHYSARLQVLRANGELRWADANTTLVWNESGDLVSMVVAIRDVTEEVAAQQVARRMLENATDVVFDVAPDNTYRWVSPSVTGVLGWDPQQLVGKSGVDLIHPDDYAAVEAARQNPHSGLASVQEFRYRRADGTFRWMSGTSREVRDQDGILHGRVVGLRDVSKLVQARDALADSERRYQLLAENAADFVVQLSTDVIIEWVSPSVTAVTGWTPQDLVGRPPSDFFPPEPVQVTEQNERRVLAGDKVSGRRQIRCADGSDRWVSRTVRPVTDDTGAVVSIISGFRDVQAEVEAEQQHRAVLDSMLDPHVLLQAVRDDAGTIVDFVFTEANMAACDDMLMGSDELVGARLLDLRPGLAGSGILTLYADAVNSGVPLVLDDCAHPYEILHDEHRYDIRAVRVGDALSFTWRDATDRYRQAEALAASELQYRLLAEHATDMVWQLDVGGVIRWMAPAPESALGWSPEQLVGTVAFDLVHPTDQPGSRVWREQITVGTPMPPLDLRMRGVDGEYRWTSVRTERILDEHGQVTGLVVGLRDSHEQVLALEALRVERARLRAILDSMLDPHILVEALRDDDGQIADLVYTDANPAACAYNGKAYDDLVGSRVLDLLPGQEASGLMAAYRRVIETGEPLLLDAFVYAHEALGGAQHFYDIRATRVGDGLSY
ncbi:MAG: PAS domain S-box protein, partial [Actinomycetes bacterium]